MKEIEGEKGRCLLLVTRRGGEEEERRRRKEREGEKERCLLLVMSHCHSVSLLNALYTVQIEHTSGPNKITTPRGHA